MRRAGAGLYLGFPSHGEKLEMDKPLKEEYSSLSQTPVLLADKLNPELFLRLRTAEKIMRRFRRSHLQEGSGHCGQDSRQERTLRENRDRHSGSHKKLLK